MEQKGLEDFSSFKEWCNDSKIMALFETKKAFDFFISRRIEELEKLQPKCETDKERNANLRTIVELKRLMR